MTSLNINGTELQPSGTNESHVESGIPSPAVTAQQTGNYIIITASTSTWYGSGTLRHYYVAANGQNNIYMATYVGSAGEVRWIQYLNRAILPGVITASDVSGGTPIESTDIDLVNGQTRSKYYSNRQAMSLTPRGATGSGLGVYLAYGLRESSSGGPLLPRHRAAGDQRLGRGLQLHVVGPQRHRGAAARRAARPVRPHGGRLVQRPPPRT